MGNGHIHNRTVEKIFLKEKKRKRRMVALTVIGISTAVLLEDCLKETLEEINAILRKE